jgi:hypothetical protein
MSDNAMAGPPHFDDTLVTIDRKPARRMLRGELRRRRVA